MLHVHRASRAGVATFHLQSEPASLCCTESDDDGHIAQEGVCATQSNGRQADMVLGEAGGHFWGQSSLTS